MVDFSFLKLGLGKTQDVEKVKKEQSSANEVELAQVGLFENSSDVEKTGDVEKISEEYTQYKDKIEKESSLKTFFDGIKEKYKAYKIKRNKKKLENLKQDIAEEKEYIKAKKLEKTSISDRTNDELLKKQEIGDIAFSEYYEQLKKVDEVLAKDLEKVKKSIDYKNVNLQTVSEDLQAKMKEIEAQVLQKYPELQAYVDKYNSIQNDYAQTKQDMLDNCVSDLEKSEKKLDRLNKKLDKLTVENDEKAVGSVKNSDDVKAGTSSVKMSDIQLSQKSQLEETLSKANDLLEKSLTYAKKLISGKEEGITTLQKEYDSAYKNLYSELRDCDTELASDLYAVKYKIDVKENQIEKIDAQVMQLKEDLYIGQNADVVKANTLSIYEEMLSDLNKFDESQLSENKKTELNKKKEELGNLIENYKKEETQSENFNAEEIAIKIQKLEKQRKNLSSEVDTLKTDMGNLQTQIKTEYPDLAGIVDKFGSSEEELSNYKTEKMEDLKSKHIKILDSRISSEIDLENIKAVETARKYEFFDTELPENFAKKLDAKLGYGFCSKLSKICKKYGISEKDLIGLMFSESGLKPQARNSNSGATGLIQFMPETAEKQLHTTTSALYDMSAVQQLDYVDKYFSSWLKEGGNYDAGELYTAVYMPSRVGRDVVAVRGGSGYSGNAGLDSNGDGQTTKAELAQKVKNKYQDALNAYNC